MLPANHYPMPTFEKFYRGHSKGIVFLLSVLLLSGVGACVCVCGKVWMVFCAVFKRTNVQREGSNPSCRISDSRDVAC